jgi:hypothetical protein
MDHAAEGGEVGVAFGGECSNNHATHTNLAAQADGFAHRFYLGVRVTKIAGAAPDKDVCAVQKFFKGVSRGLELQVRCNI